MVKRCVGQCCSNTYVTGHTHYVFQKDPRLRYHRAKFVQVKRMNITGPPTWRHICSTHFTDDCFEIQWQSSMVVAEEGYRRKKRLQGGAIHIIQPVITQEMLERGPASGQHHQTIS